MAKTQSKEWRRVFANGFSLRLGENDATLTFGFHESGTPIEEMIDEVSVVMTPRTLKIIVSNLGKVLEEFENKVGKISVPAEKLHSSFDDMLKAGIAGIEKLNPVDSSEPTN